MFQNDHTGHNKPAPKESILCDASESRSAVVLGVRKDVDQVVHTTPEILPQNTEDDTLSPTYQGVKLWAIIIMAATAGLFRYDKLDNSRRHLSGNVIDFARA